MRLLIIIGVCTLFYFPLCVFADEGAKENSSDTETYVGTGLCAATSGMGMDTRTLVRGARYSFMINSRTWALLGSESVKYGIDSAGVSIETSDTFRVYGGLRLTLFTTSDFLWYGSLCVGVVNESDVKIQADWLKAAEATRGGTSLFMWASVGMRKQLFSKLSIFGELGVTYGAGTKRFSRDAIGIPKLEAVHVEYPIIFGISYDF